MEKTCNGFAQKNRKGIFFTIIAVLLLSFMLISVGLWSNVVNARESRIPEKIKTDSMAQVVYQLSEQKMNKFVNISGYYALNRLANHSVNNRIIANGPDGVSFINKSMYDLIIYGNTSAGGSFSPNLTYTTPLEKQYTLDNWLGQMKESADVMGFDFKMDNVTNFSFKQLNAWDVQIQFNANVSIKDKKSTMMLKKNLRVNTTFSIMGMPDPLFAHKLFPTMNYSKIIFAAPDPSNRDISQYNATQISINTLRGKGWASGELTAYSNLTDEKTYILVTTYPAMPDGSPDDTAFSQMLVPQITGVIITNLNQTITNSYDPVSGCNWSITTDNNGPTRYRSMRDLNNNFIACPTTFSKIFDLNIPYLGLTNSPAASLGSQVVMQNYPGTGGDEPFTNPDYHVLYDISGARKMMECGYYVNSANTAPSFLQRMLVNGETKTSQYGIESFIVAEWAGGNIDPNNIATNGYSRIDMEYYKPTSGTRIKGGSGCKSMEMCKEGQSAENMPLGTFKLDDTTSLRYNLYKLRCNMKTPSDTNIIGGSECN